MQLRTAPITFTFILLLQNHFGLMYLNVNKIFYFTPSPVTRGHPYKLYKAQCENLTENGAISSLDGLLMYGTHCLLMLTFPHCPV